MAGPGPARSRVVGVLGGSGGVGASVVAAAIAAAAAERGAALLVDMDPLGGGLDLLLGLESHPGQRWPQFVEARGDLPDGALAPLAHPDVPGLHVLSHARTESPAAAHPSAEVVAAVLTSARSQFGTVVLDLARDPAVITGLAPAMDHLLIVTGVDVRSCAASMATVAALRRADAAGGMRTSALLSVIVRGPGPVPHDAHDVADLLGLPLAAELLWEPRLARDIEDGRVPGTRRRGQVAVGIQALLAELDQQDHREHRIDPVRPLAVRMRRPA